MDEETPKMTRDDFEDWWASRTEAEREALLQWAVNS